MHCKQYSEITMVEKVMTKATHLEFRNMHKKHFHLDLGGSWIFYSLEGGSGVLLGACKDCSNGGGGWGQSLYHHPDLQTAINGMHLFVCKCRAMEMLDVLLPIIIVIKM